MDSAATVAGLKVGPGTKAAMQARPSWPGMATPYTLHSVTPLMTLTTWGRGALEGGAVGGDQILQASIKVFKEEEVAEQQRGCIGYQSKSDVTSATSLVDTFSPFHRKVSPIRSTKCQ